VADAVREAFVSALNSGLRVGAAVAATGAVLAWMLIAPGRAKRPVPVTEPVPEVAG
jgi:hypothetical protein